MKYLFVCLLALSVNFLSAQPKVRYSEKTKSGIKTTPSRIAFSYQGNAYLLSEVITIHNYQTAVRVVNDRFETVVENLLAKDEEAVRGRFVDFFEMEQGGWYFSVVGGNVNTPAKFRVQRLGQSGLELGAVKVLLQEEVYSLYYQPTFYLDISEDRSRIMVASVKRGFAEGTSTHRDTDEVHIQVYDANMELLWEAEPADIGPQMEFVDFKVNNDGSVFSVAFIDQSSLSTKKQTNAMYLHHFDQQGDLKKHRIWSTPKLFTSCELTVLPAGDIVVAGITYSGDYPTLHWLRFDPFAGQITREQENPIKVSPLLYGDVSSTKEKDYHNLLIMTDIIVVDDKMQYVLAEFFWSRGDFTSNDLLVIPVQEGTPGRMNVLPKNTANYHGKTHFNMLLEGNLHILYNGDVRNLAEDAKYRTKQMGEYRDLIWCQFKPDGSMKFASIPVEKKAMPYAQRFAEGKGGKVWLLDAKFLKYQVGLLELEGD